MKFQGDILDGTDRDNFLMMFDPPLQKMESLKINVSEGKVL